MKIKHIWLLIFWIALISIGSCARRGVPTGGPKDTIPPTLINMNPLLETVNFDSDEILLEFDEYIEARSLKQDIIINPPVKEYDFYVSRNSLVIELNEDLQENTTYTFNFREAIKDISEQNPSENIVVAFSTGPKIDSFQIQGQVRDLFTNKPADDVLVALYPEGDTLNPFEDVPMYLTKTDEEGNYAVQYIRVGTYKIFAYNDKNNNLLLDSNTESFGFESDPIALLPDDATVIPVPDSLMNTPIDSTAAQRKQLYGKTVSLQLLKQDVRPLIVQSARPNGKYFEIKTNKSLIEYKLTADGTDLTESTLQYLDSLNADLPIDTIRYLYSNFQDDQKTIRLYNTIDQDSLKTYLTARDSVGHEIQDTIYVKFTETRRNIEPFKQSFTSKSEIKNLISAKIEFGKPITKVSTDSILLSYDTLFYLPLNYEEFMQWNETLDKVSFQKQINKNQLVDSIIVHSQRRDSLAFVREQNQMRLYLDSLQSVEGLEQQLNYFEILAQTIPSLRQLRDSLNTTEDNAIRSNILSMLADTLQINENYQPKVFSKEEILSTLKPLVLYVAGGSFMSVENDSSQQIIQRFSFKVPAEYGTITGTVNTAYERFTIQLLDSKYEVVAETQPTNNSYTIELVPPGSYHIRILVDEDQNGEWERGNILENKNSEPVYFYTDEEVIDLRANWNREINLSF
ncbi:Ig-like domain-containing domain [Catalinimonas niigatensis]|uniref:Ig-like domain-containing domain n=1 Tax=Catalinimonas niigatensis TaxID=1397264 RepID=UPI002666E54E|nr:Ig-like domain-containing domain [Catalinimonas niigatensis]WPP48125.1 Ig-like domain-containing domain [Catalinimonas niigatensis]